jgi:VCBS repeat-containing protein
MIFNTNTGVIAGTPTALSALQGYIVTVKDQRTVQLTLPVKIAVNPAPKFVKGYQSLINQQDHNDNLPQTPEVSGGSLPLRFVVEPDLTKNTGLLLSATTGTLGGLPSIVANEEIYRITALDLNDAPASSALRVLVTPELAPKIVSSEPSQGSSQIDPKLKQVRLNFNEAVNVSSSGVSLKCNDVNVPLLGLPSNNSSVLLLSWVIDLPETGFCALTIAKDAIHDSDTADGPDELEFEYVLNFTTVDQAPTVVAHTPLNNAVGVVADSKIKLKFSEKVDLQAGAVTLQCPVGSPIALIGLPASNVSEIELTPAVNLPDVATTCTVMVLKDKLNDSDNIDPPSGLAANYSFVFSVDASPKVVSATPVAGSTNGIATPVVVTFTEPVTLLADAASATCTTINAPIVTVTPAVSTSLSLDGLILTIAPAPKWAESATCTISLDPSKIKDVDNIDPPDNLNQAFSLSFQTDSSPKDIALAPSFIAENQAVNTVVGTFNTVDLDFGQMYTYDLVSGAGSADNSAFTVTGNTLVAKNPFNFESKNSYTIRVKSTDNGIVPLSVEKQLTITVTNVNESPIAINLSNNAIDEDVAAGSLVGTLSSTDPDAGDTFSYAIVAGLDGAAFSISGNELHIVNSPDFETKASYTVRIRSTDAGGLSFEKDFTISINNLNDLPVNGITAINRSTNEDTSLTLVGLSVADPDVGAANMTATLSVPVSNGTFSSIAAGVVGNNSNSISLTDSLVNVNAFLAGIQYIPLANGNGNVTATLLSNDNGNTGAGGAKTDSDTFIITINAVNDAPTISLPLSITVLEDTNTAITGITVADIDAGGANTNLLIAVSNGTLQSSSASVTISGNNTNILSLTGSIMAINSVIAASEVRYVPVADANSDVLLTATIFDLGNSGSGGALNAVGMITLDLIAVNDAPNFNNPNVTVLEDSGAYSQAWATGITAGPADESGQTLSLSVTNVSNNTLFSVQPSATNAGVLSFTPAPDAAGSSTVTVQLQDNGGVANGGINTTIKTFTITITAVDDAPIAINDAATVSEDSGATAVTVLANDTDVDAGPKTINTVTQPANGTVVITGGGTGLTYQPNANYCNNPPGTTLDTFTYTLAPGGSSATVTMTVTCIDDAPVAVNDATTVSEDSGATAVTVLTNDTDVDGGPKTINTVTQPANGTVVITGGGTGLTYQPNANYCNNPPSTTLDTFTYTLNGGSSATVTMTVTCIDDVPVAVNDAATVSEDSGATAVTVLTNDTDVDGGPKTINTVTQPANGTVVITGGGTGLTYQPNANYCNNPPGTTLDTFTYTLAPGGSSATVTMTVTCIDDAPVAVNDAATVSEDSGTTAVTVLTNDTDVDAGPKTINTVTQPTNGTVVITGGGTGLTYQPNANYCNNPPGTTLDTFTYTLNGGSSATVTMTVTCIDDVPVAVNDAVTVSEDSGVAAVIVLTNDTDVDAGPKTINTVTQPTNGTVVITGGGTGLTYQTNANYCNNPPGTTLDTFTYTLNGGSSATVTMTVTCIDDAPVAVNDAATVSEDSGATAVTVLINDTDVDAGPKTINTVTQPTNGTVVITGGGTGLTYQPNANYCNNPPGTTLDTFTYTLNGGSSATVTITVTCIDDAPIAVNDAATVNVNTIATAVTVLTNDTDVDAGPKTINIVTQPANGTVVITGGGTGLTYQPNANYCNNPPGTTLDTFTYTLNGGSSATVTVTVTCNTPPVLVAGNMVTYTENGAAVLVSAGITATDGDSSNLTGATVQITGNHVSSEDVLIFTTQNGINGVFTAIDGTMTLSGSSTVANYQTALRSITYNNTSENPSTLARTVTWIANDGIANSTAVTSTINVSAVNDAPIVVAGGTANFTENGSAVAIDIGLTVSDVDNSSLGSATISITTGFSSAQGDSLAFVNANGISGSYVAGTGVLTLMGSATVANYQAALRSITYSNTSEAPTASRTISWVVNDGSTNSTAVTSTVNITAVNDAPVLAAAAAGTITMNEQTTTAISATGLGITDVDDTNIESATVIITGNFQTGEDVLSVIGALPGAITANTSVPGTVTLMGSATLANYTTALRQIAYTNSSNTPNTALTRTVSFTVNDGNTDSNTVTRDMTVVAVSDPPTQTAPSYTGNANLTLTVPDGASDLLTGAIDPDGTVVSVVAAILTSANGGSATVVANGSFVYNPPAGFVGNDTFVYQIQDTGSPIAQTTNVTATVTLTDTDGAGAGNSVLWFIDEDATASTGVGTQANPFKTLSAFNTANTGVGDLPNNTDFIFIDDDAGADNNGDGAGIYLAGITLRNNQKLIGDGTTGTTLAAITGITLGSFNTLDAFSGTRPVVANLGSGGNAITLAQNNMLRGLNVGNSGGAAYSISGASVGNLNVGEVNINNAIGGALNLGSGTIAATFGSISSSGASVTGVNFSTIAGSFTASTIAVSNTTGAARGIELAGNTTGTFNLGAVTINTTADIGFIINGGSSTVTASTVTISNSGNRGLYVQNTSGGSVTFGSVAISGSAQEGIFSLNNANTITINGGSLQTSAGTEVYMAGGTGNFTYAGTITEDTGTLIYIENTTGGTKTFSGAISDGNDGDGSGIGLFNNTGATINFTGGLTLSTGSLTAFSATAGGTVNVTGTNTITTTTGTALSVTNTTIGASGLNFQSINSNGAANGIALNNTGASGGLTVTGDGGGSSNGSGGTIQNATAEGILLISTQNVNLGYINVQNSNEDGIYGQNVTNFTLNRSNITGSGDDSEDVGVRFGHGVGPINGTLGTFTINNSTVTGSELANVLIHNTTGTTSAFTLSNSNFSNLGTTFGGNSILVSLFGNAIMTSGLIDTATIANNGNARGLTVQAQSTGAINSNIDSFTVQNSTFTNNGLHTSFEQSGGANFAFKFLNNNLQGAAPSHALNIASSSTATGGTLQGRVVGNIIGTAATAGSGSTTGNGIRVFIQGKTAATLLIDNNTIRQTHQARGIDAQFLGTVDSSAAPTSDITIINNNVVPGDITGFPLSAIYLAADSQTGGAVTVRADVRGNTVPSSGTVFDSLNAYLIVDEVVAAAAMQLVDSPPASANATAQLTSTNTGSASANAGVALIAGPITTPP